MLVPTKMHLRPEDVRPAGAEIYLTPEEVSLAALEMLVPAIMHLRHMEVSMVPFEILSFLKCI
jgi:hypothetical protein